MGGSYRKALAETVHHYSGWRPDPHCIDALKSEGVWNNDWDASLELLKRQKAPLPKREHLRNVFSDFYFGGDPQGATDQWQGYICTEPLLVNGNFFNRLTAAGIAWGFVSGAEPASARYVLEQRLGLKNPPLLAMGDAPDKPNPQGLIQLATELMASKCDCPLGREAPAIAYLGDTVADVLTVINARQQRTDQRWLSLAVAPPHLHTRQNQPARHCYEDQLRLAGADHILDNTDGCLDLMRNLGLTSPYRPGPSGQKR